MSRSHRHFVANGIYHVRTSGNNGERIVLGPKDVDLRCEMLTDVVRAYGWRIAGWAMFDCEEEMVLQTPQPNLDLGMQALNCPYSRKFNRAHGRTGHLVRNGYDCHLLEDDRLLIDSVSYLLAQPVHRRLVETVDAYAWSSCAATISGGAPLAFIDVPRVLDAARAVAPDADPRATVRSSIARHVACEGAPPWAGAADDFLVGSAEFVRAMRELIAAGDIGTRLSVESITKAVSKHVASDDSQIWRAEREGTGWRDILAYLLREFADCDSARRAAVVGLSERGARRAAMRARTSPVLRDRARAIVEQLRGA